MYLGHFVMFDKYGIRAGLLNEIETLFGSENVCIPKPLMTYTTYRSDSTGIYFAFMIYLYFVQRGEKLKVKFLK